MSLQPTNRIDTGDLDPLLPQQQEHSESSQIEFEAASGPATSIDIIAKWKLSSRHPLDAFFGPEVVLSNAIDTDHLKASEASEKSTVLRAIDNPLTRSKVHRVYQYAFLTCCVLALSRTLSNWVLKSDLTLGVGDVVGNGAIAGQLNIYAAHFLRRVKFGPELALALTSTYFALGESVLPKILPGTADLRDIPAALLMASISYLFFSRPTARSIRN